MGFQTACSVSQWIWSWPVIRLLRSCPRLLGRNGHFKLRLCSADGLYVTFRVYEGSLSLGLHAFHLRQQIKVDPMGAEKDIARERVKSSESLVEILSDSRVGSWVARFIEEAILRERTHATDDNNITQAASRIA